MSKATAKAYDAIRGEILSGGFAPGARLKEEELVELCGVSRTPVREALRRLQQEGLVECAPNRGAFVREWSFSDMEEIFSLRAVLESYAARRAAQNLTTAQLAELRGLCGRMERAVRSGDADTERVFLDANSKFHRIILDAAGSARLSAMLRYVVETPLIMRTFARYSPDEVERSLRHHRELVEAFAMQDSDWAAAVMSSHIRAAYGAVLKNLRPEALSALAHEAG